MNTNVFRNHRSEADENTDQVYYFKRTNKTQQGRFRRTMNGLMATDNETTWNTESASLQVVFILVHITKYRIHDSGAKWAQGGHLYIYRTIVDVIRVHWSNVNTSDISIWRDLWVDLQAGLHAFWGDVMEFPAEADGTFSSPLVHHDRKRVLKKFFITDIKKTTVL